MRSLPATQRAVLILCATSAHDDVLQLHHAVHLGAELLDDIAGTNEFLIAQFAGGAAAAYAFVYVLPAEKAAGDIEAASAATAQRNRAAATRGPVTGMVSKPHQMASLVRR